MSAVLALVRANLIRLVRERASIFFVVVFPLAIVIALGAAIGGQGSAPLLGYHDGSRSALSRQVLDRLDASATVKLKRFDSAAAVRDAAARNQVDAAIDLSNHDGSLRVTRYPVSQASGLGVIQVLNTAAGEASAERQVVDVLVSRTGAEQARVSEAVAAAQQAVATPRVRTQDVGGSFGADPSQIRTTVALGVLTMFIFMTTLNGASYLLTSRQLGVIRRMRAGPVPVGAIILGEGVSRFLVALLQAAIIVGGAAVVGTDFTRLDLIALLSAALALVGTALALLLGALARNEQQVAAVAVTGSLVLAALGGSMTPLEFFPDTLRKVAFITPHAWMNDALWRIQYDGADLADVLPAVGVLVGAGVVLLGVASWVLGRTLR